MGITSRLVSASASLPRIPVIARQMKMTRSVKSPIKHRVEIPAGFSYDAFNAIGELKPWSILRMIESSRAAVYSLTSDNQSFIDAHSLYDNYFQFIFTTELQVEREMYDLNSVKAPVIIDVELEDIGNTSFQLKFTGFCGKNTSDPMFTSHGKTVLVGKDTRKPKTPPDWWLEKYSPAVTIGKNTMENLTILKDCNENESFKSNITVQASEVDGYLHTNWVHYVKFCTNSFVERSIANGNVQNYHAMFRQLKYLSIIYKKETSIGDLLTAQVFPHKDDADTFLFSIDKGGKVACECKMEYFSLQEE